MVRLNQKRRVDWAGLNPDLLHIIIKKLDDISTLYRCRAVCKAWEATARHAAPTSRQFPWIIQHRWDMNELECYSISSRKTHTIPLPQALVNNFLSTVASSGYILTIPEKPIIHSRLVFLNPLTSHVIPLQEDSTITPHFICHTTTETGNVILGCMAYKSSRFFLYIWRSERNKWSKVGFPYSGSVVYWRQRFYVCDYYRRKTVVIHVPEMKGHTISTIQHVCAIKHLIRTDDCLLGVSVHVGQRPICLDDFRFEVYRLENYEQNPHWVKLSSIGDLIIFIDKKNGFGLQASHFDEFRGNCIYFLDDVWKDNKYLNRALGRFDIGENKTEEVRLPATFRRISKKGPNSWFIPTP